MDTTITTLEFCAGYGGIGLGLKNIFGERMRTIAYCELEGFAQANLLSKMEKGLMDVAPLWNDLKTFPYESFHGLVDILIAGYPCQPFSSAGKRAGKEDPRHLWPWIADGIRLLRPRLCFFENVEGHISLGLREVVGELEQIGYSTAFGIFSAAEVGAPHQRKRVFILAYDQRQRVQELRWQIAGASQFDSAGNDGGDDCTKPCQFCGYEFDHELLGKYGCPNCEGEGCGELADDTSEASGRLPERAQSTITQLGLHGQTPWPSRPGEPQHGWEPPRVVANGHRPRCTRPEDTGADCGDEGQGPWREESERAGLLGHANSPRPQVRPRQRGAGIQGADADGGEDADGEAQPPVGRDPDGPAGGLGYAELCVTCDNRTDELRLLGNGVVPATAERAFRTLLNELNT